MGETYRVDRSGGPDAPTARGLDDLYLGTKIRLADQTGARPALSMEASATVPTGATAISAGAVLPGAALLLSWGSSGPWSAGIEVAGTRQSDQSTQLAASLSIQFQATSRAQLYGEWFTFQALGAGANATGQHYADSGVLVLLTQNMQADARIGFGLNGAADRLFTGVGFAIRR